MLKDERRNDTRLKLLTSRNSVEMTACLTFVCAEDG